MDGERKRFEAWHRAAYKDVCPNPGLWYAFGAAREPSYLWVQPGTCTDGRYYLDNVNDAWRAWNARASLAPAGDAAATQAVDTLIRVVRDACAGAVFLARRDAAKGLLDPATGAATDVALYGENLIRAMAFSEIPPVQEWRTTILRMLAPSDDGAAGVRVPLGPPVKCKGLVSYPVHAISLRLHGDETFVEVQRADGKWCLAIVESGNFSHEILANGLNAAAWFDTYEALLDAENATDAAHRDGAKGGA